MAEIQIASVADLTAAVAQSRTHFGGDLWWRGHALSTWQLVPGVFRGARGYNYERTVVRRFTQRARSRHEDCPANSDLPGWLFLMQHYGLPTRLLDWSESPLIALYFAALHPEADGVVHVLYPMELNDRQLKTRALVDPTGKEAAPLVLPAFHEAPAPSAAAAALIVDETDPRMLAQLTAMSIHTAPGPLEQLDGSEAFLRRFIVPAAAKPDLVWELWHHGIRRSTLFPDLSNLAAELRATTYKKA